jgi:cobalt transporter subunit CbtB
MTAAQGNLMQTEVIGHQPGAGSRTVARTDVLVGAILAAVLGAFLIWGVGFSPIDFVHNAAHDTRHSTGFPCH